MDTRVLPSNPPVNEIVDRLSGIYCFDVCTSNVLRSFMVFCHLPENKGSLVRDHPNDLIIKDLLQKDITSFSPSMGEYKRDLLLHVFSYLRIADVFNK